MRGRQWQITLPGDVIVSCIITTFVRHTTSKTLIWSVPDVLTQLHWHTPQRSAQLLGREAQLTPASTGWRARWKLSLTIPVSLRHYITRQSLPFLRARPESHKLASADQQET